jgi:hypothetical protein
MMFQMLKMNKRSLMIVAMVNAVAYGGFAQVSRTGDEDTLKTRIVTVLDYKPTVSDARKLTVAPTVIDTVLAKPEAQYTFESQQLETTYTPDSIRAAKMKGEPLDPLYRSYVKGGLGNGINYELDAYVNTLRSRDGALGVEVHGKGTQGVLNEMPPAPYNRWAAALQGKRFLKKHQLTGSLGCDRERTQYYGYSYSDSLVSPFYLDYQGGEDVFRQVYTALYANAGIKSFYTDSVKINHRVDLHYDHFFDRNAANKEHNLVLDGQVSRYLGKHLGSVDVLADFNSVDYASAFVVRGGDTASEQQSNLIVGLTPKITSQAKKWRVELGLNVMMDMRAATTDIRVYPNVYAKYNLVKEIIIPYAGVTGGLRRNNLNNLTEQNPFMWSALTPLRNTNQSFHFFGGFRGAVSQRFTYNLHAGQYKENDAPLFVNYNASIYNPGATPFGVNYFVVEYDLIKVAEFGGELSYRIGERMQVIGSGIYRDYSSQREAAAWQRPNFELSLSGFYRIQDKITAYANLFLLGPQRAKGYKDYIVDDPESVGTEFFNDLPVSVTSTTLKPIFDMNLGVEYRYTERLSGFVRLNNLLVQRYQRWNQYPVQRFNVMGGITYSFWKE